MKKLSIRKTTISILIGTIILFVWNAISWTALPFHGKTLNNIPDSVMDRADFQSQLITDGVYHYPGLPVSSSNKDLKVIEEKLANGPRITLMVYKSGSSDYFMPSQFLFGFISNLVTVILFLFLITLLSRNDMSSILKVSFVIGIIAVIISDFGMYIWNLFPLDYTIVSALDKIISFLLLGILFSLYTFKNYTNE